MNAKRNLGNIAINTFTTHQQVLECLSNVLRSRERTNLFFLNDHGFNIAQRDPDYLAILNHADLLLNDGLGVMLGAKIWNIHLEENLNGTDLIPRLLNLCQENDWSVFLLGAREAAVKSAATRLQQQFPSLQISGSHSGYMNNEQAIVQSINQSGADVLLVGMGMPLQEKFIARHHAELAPSLRIAVGGYIDFASGMKKRAPKIMRRLNLEWLFRMILEPRRMWRRNVVGHLQFFIRVIALKKYK
ncbi:MAG: WecB/TagA/CpsF family glycosyltransferase [Sporolactobacillus sp.]